MTDLMLGDLLALRGKSSADLGAWLSDHDPSTASQLASEAARRGESEAQFLRIAVSDFMAEADEESWASLISAARDARDPGAACAVRVIAFRLHLESIL